MTIDVLIVGAGPTGLTLAVDLARRGVHAVLIDAAPELPRQSRGKGVAPRTLEVFDDLGVVDAILGHGEHRQDITLYKDRRRLARLPGGLAEPRPDLPYDGGAGTARGTPARTPASFTRQCCRGPLEDPTAQEALVGQAASLKDVRGKEVLVHGRLEHGFEEQRAEDDEEHLIGRPVAVHGGERVSVSEEAVDLTARPGDKPPEQG